MIEWQKQLIENNTMSELQRDRRLQSIQRDEEILNRLAGLEHQIGECSARINGKIEERISEHRAIREMREQITAVTAGFDELKTIVKGAIGNGDRRLKVHDDDIEELRTRIAGLENAVNEIKSKISQIEHIARSNTEAINNWGGQLSRSITSLHDTVNIIAASKGQGNTAKHAAKSPFVWTAATVIGFVQLAVGIILYLISGDSTVLETLK